MIKMFVFCRGGIPPVQDLEELGTNRLMIFWVGLIDVHLLEGVLKKCI